MRNYLSEIIGIGLLLLACNSFSQQKGTVTDIIGNKYPTVVIGSLEWMVENLKATKYNDGNEIPNLSVNSAWQRSKTGAYCWYDNNENNNKDAYGALYNWYAVETGNLCPTGWRVPTDNDWAALIGFVENQGIPNTKDAGGVGSALKSCRQDRSPAGGNCTTSDHPRWNMHPQHHGLDKYGFAALPGGFRSDNGGFRTTGALRIGVNGYWWSSTEKSANNAFYRIMYHDAGHVVQGSGFNKTHGFSVRCVRDAGVSTNQALKINVSPTGGGKVTGAGDYKSGQKVNVTATPQKGYRFVNWTGDTKFIKNAIEANTTLSMPEQGITLTANFVTDGGDNTVIDADGNKYTIVVIGTQTWIVENLKTTKYNDGTEISNITVNSLWQRSRSTGAYCWYSNDESTYKDAYGAIYNWYAVETGKLCPTGWRVPSDEDWNVLVNFVVSKGYPNTKEIGGAGNALKSCRQDKSPLGGDCATSIHPRWTMNSTIHGVDKFGFSALPGGIRKDNGTFENIGTHGYWWSSTEKSAMNAWYRILYNSAGNISQGSGFFKGYGFSVRCIKE